MLKESKNLEREIEDIKDEIFRVKEKLGLNAI